MSEEPWLLNTVDKCFVSEGIRTIRSGNVAYPQTKHTSHKPVSPVIRLDLRHPRKKERTKELKD